MSKRGKGGQSDDFVKVEKPVEENFMYVKKPDPAAGFDMVGAKDVKEAKAAVAAADRDLADEYVYVEDPSPETKPTYAQAAASNQRKGHSK